MPRSRLRGCQGGLLRGGGTEVQFQHMQQLLRQKWGLSGQERKVFQADGITGLETLECDICRTNTNSLLCSENEVGPGVVPEVCAARLEMALNAKLRSLSLPTGYSW